MCFFLNNFVNILFYLDLFALVSLNVSVEGEKFFFMLKIQQSTTKMSRNKY